MGFETSIKYVIFPQIHKLICLSIVLFLIFFNLSCQTTKLNDHGDDFSDTRQQVSSGVAEEIRSLTETGVLSSMLQAIETIRARNLTGDFGRLMNGINALFIKLVYPDTLARLPAVDLPQIHNYTRIIREAEKGVYVHPTEESNDFFEHILPFLTITYHNLSQLTGENAIAASDIIKNLDKAALIRPKSLLPFFFKGKINEQLAENSSQTRERTQFFAEAERFYQQAYDISDECYPAQIGIARIRRLSGKLAEASSLYSDLIVRFPDSMEIKKGLAICYNDSRNWSRAIPLIDEILLADPRDGEFILIKSFIQIEQGQFSQANNSLDSYASINPNNRTYLYLRARVQSEGNRNRDSALNYLRSLLRASPNDEEALVYAAALLLDSSRTADQTEGKELLERLQRISGSSIDVLSLSLKDALARESWQEAQSFLNRILAVRRNADDLIDGYYVERGLGNNARALLFARELYEKDNNNNDYTVIYISALIDNGRRDEASNLLENRLNTSSSGMISGTIKSRYFFLRSRLHTNQDAALGDLRSSLFEDPRNLDALIAMFEIYHRRREERRAVYYLRQALAIAPDHPQLRRYEREYASLLGRN
ncbi:MAG: hypothetical protein FWB86_09695 [Treponema sp.]|nr:hypothetical protein [Treponema sp.]